MNFPETPDPIDKLLREQDTYVPDDGFTQRVIAGLPGRKRSLLPRMILVATVIAGAVMAALWMPWRSLPPLDYSQVFSDNSTVLSAWLPFIAVVVALSGAVMMLFRRES